MNKRKWFLIVGLFFASSLALLWSASTAGPPSCTDKDKDGICDEVDNCPNAYNPKQEDSDGDGTGDVCDKDTPGTEGCTPGFWRNHLALWPIDPNEDFDATFGVDLFNPDITLQKAVNLGGGGVNKLARHGTAALLSALHPDVDYPLDPAEVIDLVKAGDADTLAEFNELGCPLD